MARAGDVWVVDADDCVVTVVRPGHDDVRVADVLTWHPDGAPVALEIPLSGIFR